MTQSSFSKVRLLAGLMTPAMALFIGTACGAQDFVGANQNGTTSPVQQGGVTQRSAELSSADQRVESSKQKLDQARKCLSAAKAGLKAAEAEFRATKADRDAIALRETATALASTSGFAVTTPSEQVRQIIVPPTGARLTPVAVQQPIIQAVSGQNPNQPVDFAAQQQDLSGAPVPVAAEPNLVR